MSGLFTKEKVIINDFKASTSTLAKNYMKWLAEYNTVILKITQRDKLKERKDAITLKIDELSQEKF